MTAGGIGKLVDGIIGDDENNWLSWNKSPVSLELNFDLSRHFKTIRIYTMSDKYQSIDIKFDDNRSISHQISPIQSSSAGVFVDTVQLIQYGILFIGKRIEIIFEFNNELLLLTEVTFDNEPTIFVNTTSTVNNTTNCPIGKNKSRTFSSN